MKNKFYRVNITNEQWENLWKALHVGSPIQIALSFAGVKTSTYYYMVKLYSTVEYCNAMEQLNDQEDTEDAMAMNQHDSHSNIAVAAYKEPAAEMIEQYMTNPEFKEYANEIHDKMEKCNKMRSEIVIFHLQQIRDGSVQRGKNTNPSQWFLERTMPEFFGRSEKDDPATQTTAPVTSIKVEYVNPNEKESENRVRAMEEQLLQEYNGESKA